MNLIWSEKIANWNPQLYREIKGRFHRLPMAIAIGISIFVQILVVLFAWSKLPGELKPLDNGKYDCFQNQYLRFRYPENFYSHECWLKDGYPTIDWSYWCLDLLFPYLSLILVFALLTIGTYLLINDLAQEEHRGTLNFIRLSPQSIPTTLIGKLLGVPSLLYLGVMVAIPLHLLTGITAQIPLGIILSFYGILAASCICFYSGAMLFGLVSFWLNGFQPWLGSGLVLLLLCVTNSYSGVAVITYYDKTDFFNLFFDHNETGLFNLFSPRFLIVDVFLDSELSPFQRFHKNNNFAPWEWHDFPLSHSSIILTSLMLGNYVLWTRWIWVGLVRCFRHPGTTILNKKQSYFFVACFSMIMMVFSVLGRGESNFIVLVFHLFLFVGLIIILSPQRQSLQNWARYQQKSIDQTWWKKSLILDLIWGENSPAIVAIAINFIIAAVLPILSWILIFPNKTQNLIVMGILGISILIYAMIAQLVLLLKRKNQVVWASITLMVIMFLSLMLVDPHTYPALLLLSAFPLVEISKVGGMTIFLCLLVQVSVLSLLSVKLTQQIQILGESGSKNLLMEKQVNNMNLLWLEKIANWNPQLYREIKGRLNRNSVAIATGISLFSQILVILSFWTKLPSKIEPFNGKYDCNVYNYLRFYHLPHKIYETECILTNGHPTIDWSYWWLDIFLWLSFISVFALLTIGIYLLINDLTQEERRGTLNFIRLSPQSTYKIFVGKLLGVPSLLYWGTILAIPLHLCAGLSAQIPVWIIFSFYGIVAASCLFFYSAAMLFGLVSSGLNGFQSWLGSGLVLTLLGFTSQMLYRPNYLINIQVTDWFNLFSPMVYIPYMVFHSPSVVEIAKGHFSYENLLGWEWYNLPIGQSIVILASLILGNYICWTGWIWLGLLRYFRNPEAIFKKRQSYLFVACFEVIILGFLFLEKSSSNYLSFLNFLILNLLMFLGLIMMLSPQRQNLQDWARYQQKSIGQKWWKQSLISDLLWGEKSPAILAIAINFIIAIIPTLFLILFSGESKDKTQTIICMALLGITILSCAVIAQIMLLMKRKNQVLWTTATLMVIVFLPPVALTILSLTPAKYPDIWLLSAFPLAGISSATGISILLALIGQLAILSLFSIKLTQKIRIAGESASQALLTGNK